MHSGVHLWIINLAASYLSHLVTRVAHPRCALFAPQACWSLRIVVHQACEAADEVTDPQGVAPALGSEQLMYFTPSCCCYS